MGATGSFNGGARFMTKEKMAEANAKAKLEHPTIRSDKGASRGYGAHDAEDPTKLYEGESARAGGIQSMSQVFAIMESMDKQKIWMHKPKKCTDHGGIDEYVDRVAADGFRYPQGTVHIARIEQYLSKEVNFEHDTAGTTRRLLSSEMQELFGQMDTNNDEEIDTAEKKAACDPVKPTVDSDYNEHGQLCKFMEEALSSSGGKVDETAFVVVERKIFDHLIETAAKFGAALQKCAFEHAAYQQDAKVSVASFLLRRTARKAYTPGWSYNFMADISSSVLLALREQAGTTKEEAPPSHVFVNSLTNNYYGEALANGIPFPGGTHYPAESYTQALADLRTLAVEIQETRNWSPRVDALDRWFSEHSKCEDYESLEDQKACNETVEIFSSTNKTLNKLKTSLDVAEAVKYSLNSTTNGNPFGDTYPLRPNDEGYVQEYAVCITVIGTSQEVLYTFVDASVNMENPALNAWFSQKDTLDGVKTLVPAISNLELVDKDQFTNSSDIEAHYNVATQTYRVHGGTSQALNYQASAKTAPICQGNYDGTHHTLAGIRFSTVNPAGARMRSALQHDADKPPEEEEGPITSRSNKDIIAELDKALNNGQLE